jgi:hypothetical protein
MKYHFLTNDVVKSKLAAYDSRIKKNFVVKRRLTEKDEIEFEFYNRNKKPEVDSKTGEKDSVVIILSDQELNLIFLKEIRKEKLQRLNKLALKRKLAPHKELRFLINYV